MSCLQHVINDGNIVTGNTATKLTSGNKYDQANPTITTDLNGNVYVMWKGETSTSSSVYNIRMLKYDGSTWGSITEITSQSTASIYNPSMCDNYYNFEKPITVWQDGVNSRTAFYGKWQCLCYVERRNFN